MEAFEEGFGVTKTMFTGAVEGDTILVTVTITCTCLEFKRRGPPGGPIQVEETVCCDETSSFIYKVLEKET